MTDRELLELAAKAAGYVTNGYVDQKVVFPPPSKAGGFVVVNNHGGDSFWNPLNDDGDAFRLAIKMKMDIDNNHRSDENNWVSAYCVYVGDNFTGYYEDFIESKRDEFTRRAIVNAAAEIGKSLS